MAEPYVITYSREKLRSKFLETINEIFKAKNLTLDLENSSFGIFLVNLNTAILSDLFNFSNFLYGETSLVTASLPESVNNWATYIDYEASFATSAQLIASILFPYDNAFTCEMRPYEFYMKSSEGIMFTIDKPVRIVNSSGDVQVQLIDEETNTYVSLPWQLIIDESGKKYILIERPAFNKYLKEFTFRIPPLRQYQFHDVNVGISEGERVVDTKLYVDNEEWTRGVLVLSGPYDKVYEVVILGNNVSFRLGNDIFGKQPNGDNIRIILTLCNGEQGNIQAGSLDSADTLYNLSGTGIVDCKVTNRDKAVGGKSSESMTLIKRNAPVSLRQRYRLVTLQDFIDDVKKVEFVHDAFVFLKRSDTRTNDVDVFLVVDDFRPDKKYVFCPSSTITVKYNYPFTDVLFPFYTELQSVDPYDGQTKFYTPVFTIIDYDTDTWYSYIIPDSIDYTQVSCFYDYLQEGVPSSVIPVGTSCECKRISIQISRTEKKITFKVLTSVSSTSNIKQKIVIRRKGGSQEVASEVDLQAGFSDFVTHEYIYSDASDLMKIISLHVHNLYINGNSQVLVSGYSIGIDFFTKFVDYGPVYRVNNSSTEAYVADIPVFQKDYCDELTVDIKESIYEWTNALYNTVFLDEKKRLLNVRPHLRFIRTSMSPSKLRNFHLGFGDEVVLKVVNSKTSTDSLAMDIGSSVVLSDPIPESDPWFDKAGSIVTLVGVDQLGNRIYTFKKPGQGTLVKNLDDGKLYYVVDTRWNEVVVTNPLEVEVEIYVSDPSVMNLLEKYKEKICEFINNKMCEEEIRFSHLVKYLQEIQGTVFVRVIKPKYDLFWKYSKGGKTDVGSKLEILMYSPEKVFTTKDFVTVHLKVAYGV